MVDEASGYSVELGGCVVDEPSRHFVDIRRRGRQLGVDPTQNRLALLGDGGEDLGALPFHGIEDHDALALDPVEDRGGLTRGRLFEGVEEPSHPLERADHGVQMLSVEPIVEKRSDEILGLPPGLGRSLVREDGDPVVHVPQRFLHARNCSQGAALSRWYEVREVCAGRRTGD